MSKKRKKKKGGRKMPQKATSRPQRERNGDGGQNMHRDKKPPKTVKEDKKAIAAQESPLDRLEFHRDRYALLHGDGNARPPTAFSFTQIAETHTEPEPSCNCGMNSNCPHRKELERLIDEALNGKHHRCDTAFRKSLWHEIAAAVSEKTAFALSRVKTILTESSSIEIRDMVTGKIFCSYFGAGEPDRRRFVDRFPASLGSSGRSHARFAVLNDITDSFISASDRFILSKGCITPRLIKERSFWMRLAYHMHWEFNEIPEIETALTTDSPELILTASMGGRVLSRIAIPEESAAKCLEIISKRGAGSMRDTKSKAFVRPFLKIGIEEDGSVLIAPFLSIIRPDGEIENREVEFIPRISAGDLAVIAGIGLVEMQEPEHGTALPFSSRTRLKGEQIPDFIREHQDILANSQGFDVAPEVLAMKVHDMKKLELLPRSLEADFCEFSISYSGGSSDISLYEILRLRKEREKYVKSDGGWVRIADMPLEKDLEAMEDIIGDRCGEDSARLSKMDFLRMLAVAKDVFNVGSGALSGQLRNLMELRPALISPRLEGLSAILRHYQEAGLHWLTFLAENSLGGLLCDDMGLGKTHQTMALMIAMKEEMNETRPFLVVCPTTVIGHWEDKITRFAPGLRPIVFHGSKREMEREFLPGDTLLTSYGILRNDIEYLAETVFGLVVFDEIQSIKNKDTLSYRAAGRLKRRMALGLSGTPIENSLLDLKALMDIVLPGYLGNDRFFEREYLAHSDFSVHDGRRSLLRRYIAPFTLRRLKSSVLSELPPKIEDTRKCGLSPEQVKLYKEALDIKAGSIRNELIDGDAEIPYLHILALLNLLKQICDHPALLEGNPENYTVRSSGKWELFTEILEESLDSGQKVVVFSQYLGMVEIIRLHLESMHVGHVVLTGSTTDRTKLIGEFNSNPECRVFVGSLKAGGTGIDLVAASVVIHYDRWWNSAREEQATDRVHRIGQTRGVQVFKFITGGTLEERIDSIISKKKSMLNEIVGEDDAGVLKSLSRNDFLELLKAPNVQTDN